MKLNKIVIVISLLIGMTEQCYSTGIPDVDIARITQAAEQAKVQAQEALAQLNTAKDAIAQAKGQYEKYESMVKGNSNLGDWLRDSNVSDLFPESGDWADLYDSASDLTSLRSKYGLTSSNSDIQSQFDKLLSEADVLEKNYKASSTRIKNLNSLRSSLNTAVTQQQKADLALRLQDEQLELNNQKVQLENTNLLMQKKKEASDMKYGNDMADYYMGKTTNQPTKEYYN